MFTECSLSKPVNKCMKFTNKLKNKNSKNIYTHSKYPPVSSGLIVNPQKKGYSQKLSKNTRAGIVCPPCSVSRDKKKQIFKEEIDCVVKYFNFVKYAIIQESEG